MNWHDVIRRLLLVSPFVRPQLDIGAVEPTEDQLTDAVTTAGYWLDPQVFGEFDATALPLQPASVTRLRELAGRFTEVARQTRLQNAPTREQVVEGRRLFVAIRELLDLYRGDHLSLMIADHIFPALRAACADWLLAVSVQVGEDMDGDPAVWVDLIVRDEAAERDDTYRLLPQLQSIVLDKLHRPYTADRIVYLQVEPVGSVLELFADAVE